VRGGQGGEPGLLGYSPVLDPSVHGTALLCRIVRDRFGGAVALSRHLGRRNALGDEILLHRLSSSLGELHVVGRVADRVGVALDLQGGDWDCP
jgi:hypothetical protein